MDVLVITINYKLSIYNQFYYSQYLCYISNIEPDDYVQTGVTPIEHLHNIHPTKHKQVDNTHFFFSCSNIFLILNSLITIKLCQGIR